MTSQPRLADRIRSFAMETAVTPARRAGPHAQQIRIRAGDIHSGMQLHNRMPAVCAALHSRKFQQMANLTLTRREGPHQGANAIFYFQVGHASNPPPPVYDGRQSGKAAANRPARSQTDQDRKIYPPEQTVFLVSCVKTKLDRPAPAKDLYVSSWFQKARRFVEQTRCPWFILSAQYGLVRPDTVLAPYEQTLNTLGAPARKAWARQVMEAFKEIHPRPSQVVMLAGARYREHLAAALDALGVQVDVPMAGLGLGQQLSWLDSHADN